MARKNNRKSWGKKNTGKYIRVPFEIGSVMYGPCFEGEAVTAWKVSGYRIEKNNIYLEGVGEQGKISWFHEKRVAKSPEDARRLL